MANKWISKNTSPHLSSPRVLLFPNTSFPAEQCFCRNVSLWRSYSWRELEQLPLLRISLKEGLLVQKAQGWVFPARGDWECFRVTALPSLHCFKVNIQNKLMALLAGISQQCAREWFILSRLFPLYKLFYCGARHAKCPLLFSFHYLQFLWCLSHAYRAAHIEILQQAW